MMSIRHLVPALRCETCGKYPFHLVCPLEKGETGENDCDDGMSFLDLSIGDVDNMPDHRSPACTSFNASDYTLTAEEEVEMAQDRDESYFDFSAAPETPWHGNHASLEGYLADSENDDDSEDL
jgi:hypothetical protein